MFIIIHMQQNFFLLPGVAVGMGMPGLDDIVNTGQALTERGYKRVSPYFIPRILINIAAGHISMKYGFKVRKSIFQLAILQFNLKISLFSIRNPFQKYFGK